MPYHAWACPVYLDRDLLPRRPVHGPVHLRQARDADRRGVELGEQLLDRRAHVRAEHGVDVRGRRRLAPILQRPHRARPLDGQHHQRRDVLAELDEDACHDCMSTECERGARGHGPPFASSACSTRSALRRWQRECASMRSSGDAYVLENVHL
jgi:hypothetical protein